MKHFRTALLIGLAAGSAFAQDLGIFTNSGDVGDPAKKGTTAFSASNGTYRVTGSGENIWAMQDQFQYVWKEMTGNFTMTATMEFLGKGADHRKAGIMVRQGLETDATYADVVVHGNGMPAIQWRSNKGEDTNTFDMPFDGPAKYTLKFVRNGVHLAAYFTKDGGETKEVHYEVTFRGPMLVGLAVCSHDAKASDTVVFSGVSVEAMAPPPGQTKQ